MTSAVIDDKPQERRGLRRWSLPIIIAVAWMAASHLGAVDPRLLPAPETVLRRGWTEATQGRLGLDVATSLARDLAGFALGAALGAPFGLALGLSRRMERFLGPSFDALKQIAAFAWIPLISVWFGVGEEAKAAFIALASFTPVAVNAWAGACAIPRDYFEVARVLTFSRLDYVLKVALPCALPSVLIGLHTGLIYSWLATVGAEYFMTIGPGVGGLMTTGRELFEMDLVILGVVLLGLIGLAFNLAAALVERRLLAWRTA